MLLLIGMLLRSRVFRFNKCEADFLTLFNVSLFSSWLFPSAYSLKQKSLALYSSKYAKSMATLTKSIVRSFVYP